MLSVYLCNKSQSNELKSSPLFVMMDVSVILFAAVVLLIIYMWKMWKFHYASFKIQGPTPLPLLGNSLEFLGTNEDLNNTIAKLHETYGTRCKVWLGLKFIVAFSDPEDLKILLNNPNSLNKLTIYKFGGVLVKDSIFLKDVSRWRQHRKLLESTFSTNILNSFISTFEKYALTLCEDLERMVANGVFDVLPLISIRSLDIILETAMGTEESLPLDNSNYEKWVQEFMALVYERIACIWHHPDFIYKLTKNGKRSDECMRNIRSYNETVIQEKKRLYKENKQGQIKQKVFLNYLLEISRETGQFTEKEIRDEVGAFIIAGSHSTALTLSFTLMLLGMHPEIQNKAYNELQEIFNGADRNITKEDLNNMNYLQRVIKESMRLFPFAPLIGRNAAKDIQLNNCFIPKGTDCILGIFYTHRDPNLWPDPLKFDPDRFLPEEIQKRHPYSWIPFSGGPRNCIGLRYAMMSMKVVLSYVIRKYKVHCDYKSVDDVKVRFDTVLTAIDGYLISLELRKASE